MANYPDWVLKHKKKGTYVNKVGDKYYLYAAHSERIKGTKKVKRINDGYLGRITEHEGFIPSQNKILPTVTCLEFGLSFLVLCTTQQIHNGLRRNFSKYGDLVYAYSILSYIYGMYDQHLLVHSYLSLHFPNLPRLESLTDAQIIGIERGQRMIADTLSSLFQEDLTIVRAHFSTVYLLRSKQTFYQPKFSPTVSELSKKYHIDWSTALWQK